MKNLREMLEEIAAETPTVEPKTAKQLQWERNIINIEYRKQQAKKVVQPTATPTDRPKLYYVTLNTPHVSPIALKTIENTHSFETEVKSDGTIDIKGHNLVFSFDALPPKTKVITDPSGGFVVYKLSQYRAFQGYKEHLHRLELERRMYALLQRYYEAKAYYNKNQFPVDFHINIKEVLSGLSANSCGDGQKRNTVLHVILREDLQHGRLKRKSGDFLCTQVNGGDWSGTRNDPMYDGGYYGVPEFTHIITCKACKRRFEKISRK